MLKTATKSSWFFIKLSALAFLLRPGHKGQCLSNSAIISSESCHALSYIRGQSSWLIFAFTSATRCPLKNSPDVSFPAGIEEGWVRLTQLYSEMSEGELQKLAEETY